MLGKLRKRFILITMSLICVILVVIFSGIYLFMAQMEKTQTLDAMEAILKSEGTLPPHIAPPMFNQNKTHREEFNRPNNALFSNSFVATIEPTGTINVRSLGSGFDVDEELSQIEYFINLAQAQNTDQGIIKVNGTEVRFLRRTTKLSAETIVFTDRSFEILTLNKLILGCLCIGFLSFVILFFICLYLSRWAIKPMAKAWEKQKQFVADASHELKTPLAVIATNTDVILSTPQDTISDQGKWLGYIKTETERMTRLVNDLLYLAKMDDDEHLVHKMNFNLSEALMNVCLPFECIIFESHKIFNMYIEEEIFYYGDEGRLKQLAVILLDNAIKHTEEKGTIDFDLHLDQSKNKIQLCVTNTGQGISLEHQAHLFERFYRVDKSRARETGGYGLGLAIAKSITEQHGGTIEVKSSAEGPTSFILSLPLKNKCIK